MRQNIGSLDRSLRVAVSVIIILAGVIYRSWWGVVGLLPLITGLSGFCGLYYALGMRTNRTNKGQESTD